MTTHHGYVDESIRAGAYRLTLVRIPSTEVATVTRAVRRTILSGQYRVHLSSDRPARQRAILKAYATLDIDAVVYETPYRLGDPDQVARDRCLRALVTELRPRSVGVVVFDTRGHDRDQLDRSTIARALGGAGADGIAYSHRGSRDDALLSLPDAIGWAAGRGSQWWDLVAGMTTIRLVPESG